MEAQTEFNLELSPGQIERNIQFETVYKRILPGLNNHGGKLLAAQLMLTLKLEGRIGKNLSQRDIDMIESIKDNLLEDPTMCKQATALISQLRG